jgi:hypothetical protein
MLPRIAPSPAAELDDIHETPLRLPVADERIAAVIATAGRELSGR